MGSWFNLGLSLGGHYPLFMSIIFVQVCPLTFEFDIAIWISFLN